MKRTLLSIIHYIYNFSILITWLGIGVGVFYVLCAQNTHNL